MDDFDRLRHLDRFTEACEVVREFLPDVDVEHGWSRAEIEDAVRCGDQAQRQKISLEIERRTAVHGKLLQLYQLMERAEASRCDELSVSTAAEIKRAAIGEFFRRVRREEVSPSGRAGDEEA